MWLTAPPPSYEYPVYVNQVIPSGLAARSSYGSYV